MDIKVGDILANIRKSVDEDMDAIALPSTASQARGTLMRGVLREMRVTMAAEPPPPAPSTSNVREEIETLRDRIKRKGEASSLFASLPGQPQPYQPVSASAGASPPPSIESVKMPAPRGAFSGILAGEKGQRTNTPPRLASAAPPLRPSFAEEDYFSGDYEPHQQATGFADTQHEDWTEQDPYLAAAEQPYSQPPHFHDRLAAEQHYPLVPQQPLLSGQAEAATEAAFRHLSETILARATSERGLEDMTRDLLRGMIKQWLDANLPRLVEDMVREEIERVARRGR